MTVYAKYGEVLQKKHGCKQGYHLVVATKAKRTDTVETQTALTNIKSSTLEA